MKTRRSFDHAQLPQDRSAMKNAMESERLRHAREDDARAIADRFTKEHPPLYRHVTVHTLLDGEVTVSKLREEMDWLEKSVRPGQVDRNQASR